MHPLVQPSLHAPTDLLKWRRLECPSGVTTALERKRIQGLCRRLPRLNELTLQSIEAVHVVLDEVQEGTAPACCPKLVHLFIDLGRVSTQEAAHALSM
jgi:hypothetical protein